MLNNVITREDLIKPVAAVLGSSEKQARQSLNAVFAVLADTVRSGQSVQIKGLGSWTWLPTLERQRRNPGTGGTVIVPAGRRLRFKPSPLLKKRGETNP
jgi:DNA-binding protein HU-beta